MSQKQRLTNKYPKRLDFTAQGESSIRREWRHQPSMKGRQSHILSKFPKNQMKQEVFSRMQITHLQAV